MLLYISTNKQCCQHKLKNIFKNQKTQTTLSAFYYILTTDNIQHIFSNEIVKYYTRSEIKNEIYYQNYLNKTEYIDFPLDFDYNYFCNLNFLIKGDI